MAIGTKLYNTYVTGSTTGTSIGYGEAYNYYNQVVYPYTYMEDSVPKVKSINKTLTFEEKLQDEIDNWLSIFKEN